MLLKLLSILAIWTPFLAYSGETIWEQISEEGVAARLTKSSVHATSSNVFLLYIGIIADGSVPLEKTAAVFKADKADTIIVKWKNSTSIEVCHEGARIWHFTNFQSVKVSQYKFVSIDISLREHDCSK